MLGFPLPISGLSDLTHTKDIEESRVELVPSKWVCWLASLALLLSGCASAPLKPITSVSAMTQRETLPFNLNARIAVRHVEQRHSGGLRWQHEAQRDELLLQGPLGITVARIVSDAHSASLEQGGKIYQAQDVEALMQSVLGWGMPLPMLHHWLLAEADDSLPAEVERDELGRITVLRQAGWEARYLRYADGQPDSLPTRISLSREDLQVQLLIDEWEWNP